MKNIDDSTRHRFGSIFNKRDLRHLGFSFIYIKLRAEHSFLFGIKCLLEQRLSSVEQQKWLSKLLGYDYKIIYCCGAANKAADALSRISDPHLLAITSPIFSGINDIIQECHNDSELGVLIEALHQNQNCKPHYSYIDGALRYKGRVVVVSTSPWCSKLLYEFHATPIGGHSGILRTYKRLQQIFYWKGMKNSTKSYIAQCDACPRNKSEAIAPLGILQPLPILDDVWLDRLTKYAHFIALFHPYTAVTIAEVFVRDIVRLHSVPRTIVSDRYPIFLSNFWEAYFAMQDTQLCRSSAYHPQSDGHIDVTNRTLECYLHCFAGMKPREWSKWLSWAEWCYNTMYHSAIKMTPFEALYSRPPPNISAYLPGSASVRAMMLAYELETTPSNS